MSNWGDVNNGRSNPTKRAKADDLRVRTDSRPWMTAAEKRAARQAKIERLTAETERCHWCNEPMWRDVHGECPPPDKSVS